jgi:DNA helicase IV
LSNSGHAAELQREREHIGFLYKRLDAEFDAAVAERDAALLDNSSRLPQARWQRDQTVGNLSARISRLRAAEFGLCFGRIDGMDGEATYIGRLGLLDEAADFEPLLLDWRAPAARPFYTATGANPEGLVRRRHFRTSLRTVVDLHDDVFEASAAEGSYGSDTALLAALTAPRDSTMRDIVSTIQSEQDEIIRLGHAGVVVIDGGPGTGKTAVALHRVAYLLYNHRERLTRSGVLIIGPNSGFLRYISDVLPSLGETDVVFATLGELLPGVATSAEDEPEVKRLKGSAAMVGMLAAAVADRQELPSEALSIELDDVTVPLDASLVSSAREAARASGQLHNPAREVFTSALLDGLTARAVSLIDADLEAMLAEDLRADLAEHEGVAAAVERCWPALSPQRLLAELVTSAERLAAAGAPSSFLRARGSAWTVSDVALLDEAAELLGPAPSSGGEEEFDPVEYAAGVLEILDTEEDPDNELLRAVDLLEAEDLAERHEERDHRTLAERAAADREWTYGHVVVDEAQELSEMDWRAVMRRCPLRSITVVGDLVQRESPAGARSWSDMLSPFVADRWAHRRLTVNYRTPAEIMDVAVRVLDVVDPPVSVRRAGEEPWACRVSPDSLASAVREAYEAHVSGTVAVIASPGVALDVPTLTPHEAKGLEFDTVLVVEPDQILAGPRGAADLYVTLSRATQRLGILHTGDLPRALVVQQAADLGRSPAEVGAQGAAQM